MKGECGYWFALPRLCARLSGRKVRRAEWSRWEAYGLGWLVFGIGCVFLVRCLFGVVESWLGRVLCLLLAPIAVWLACLLTYFVNWLLAKVLRRLELYSGPTNRSLQSFIIIALVTLLAALLVRDETGWMRSLGIFWLALVGLNLAAECIERIA